MRKMRVSWILGSRDNPLLRRVDRIEAAVLVGLIMLFVISAPVLAIVAAHLTDAAGMRELRAQSTLRRVFATVVNNAPRGRPVGLAATGNPSLVEARWRAPDGGLRTGLLDLAQDAPDGTRVPIWVTKSGQPADPPLSRTELIERVALAAAGAVLGMAAVMLTASRAARLAADRRRMADWARDWAATSPRWSRFG